MYEQSFLQHCQWFYHRKTITFSFLGNGDMHNLDFKGNCTKKHFQPSAIHAQLQT
jgi:hypothetical protein